MPTHGEQLLDRRWQRRRNEILTRDNFACTNPKCTSLSNSMLDVHHVDYIPSIMLWEYPDDMLKTLCRPCHQKEQERPKHEKYLINSLKMKGFLDGDLLAFSCRLESDLIFTSALLQSIRDFQK